MATTCKREQEKGKVDHVKGGRSKEHKVKHRPRHRDNQLDKVCEALDKISLSVRLKLAFYTTCVVCVLVLAQGPSFIRLRRALLRQRGVHKMRGSDNHLERSGTTMRSSTSIEESQNGSGV